MLLHMSVSAICRRPATCRLFAVTVLLAPFLGGCVALELPSERYFDPEDRGGLFGDWRPGPAKLPAAEEWASGIQPAEMLAAESTVAPGHACGSACTVDDCQGGILPMEVDPATGLPCVKKPDAPEVPWPRFHPVPTRPVFGTHRRPVFGKHR